MGKKWLSAVLVGLAISSILNCAKKSNPKAGIISADEVWTGKVNVLGDIFVPEGITLTLEPGAEVFFSPQTYRFDDVKIMREQFPAELISIVDNRKCDLIIEGTLRAIGGKGNLITIGNDLWAGGIIFQGENNHSVLKYCRIRDGFVGIRCLDSAQIEISHSELTGNDWGIICEHSSSPRVFNNIIEESRVIGIATGDSSSPSIRYNMIRRNLEGIVIQNQAKPEIADNTFINNRTNISDYR